MSSRFALIAIVLVVAVVAGWFVMGTGTGSDPVVNEPPAATEAPAPTEGTDAPTTN